LYVENSGSGSTLKQLNMFVILLQLKVQSWDLSHGKCGISEWAVFYVPTNTVGYAGDGFYRSDDPTNSVKALKEGG